MEINVERKLGNEKFKKKKIPATDCDRSKTAGEFGIFQQFG
jgi:hypothetical protein